jgi:hypothetical protein
MRFIIRSIVVAMIFAGGANGAACNQAGKQVLVAGGDGPSGENRVVGEYLVTLIPGADINIITS